MNLHRRARAAGGLARGLFHDLAAATRGAPDPRPIGGATLGEADLTVVRDALRGRHADPGEVTRYERAFAAWNGSRHASAWAAGRVALAAILQALDLPPGAEVILPAYTCVVVPNAVRAARLTVRWADIELDTYGLDLEAARRAIGPPTRAIVLQHAYGYVSRDAAAIRELARSRGLRVIEDCAHSTGAIEAGVRVGNLGDAAFYSTEKSKVMCTVHGGVAVTNDPTIAARLEAIAAKASTVSPARVEHLLRQAEHLVAARRGRLAARWSAFRRCASLDIASTTTEEVCGAPPPDAGLRLAPPLAAIGRTQLDAIDDWNDRRRAQASRWADWADARELGGPLVTPGSTPVALGYPIRVTPAEKADPRPLERAVGAHVGRWFLGTEHPRVGVAPGCPNAATAVDQCVYLPGIP